MTRPTRLGPAWLLALLLPTLAPAAESAPQAPPVAGTSQPGGADKPSTAGEPIAPQPTPPLAPTTVTMSARWATSFYGFVEFDLLHDSTQSFQEGFPGSPLTARPETPQSQRGRTVFTARNTRLGFRIAPPVWEGIKATGTIEADFEGNQPSSPPTISEQSFYVTATPRLRQGNVRLETPWVDVVMGQTWALFGWQAYFFPATVENIPVPGVGEPFNRSAQLRVSRTVKTGALTIDLAAAAARPPQRDAEVPDLQAGLRVALDGWKGIHTPGFGGTTADPLTLAVSGAARKFHVGLAPASGAAATYDDLWGSGFSFDALLPVIPVTDAEHRGNALTLTGTLTKGRGIGDLIAGTSGGTTNPSTLSSATPVDAGLLAVDAGGHFHGIDWRGFLVGAQYYLPPSGRVFVSANFGSVYSSNVASFVVPDATKLWYRARYADANLFVDVTPAVRTGVSWEWLEQTYVDEVKARNTRLQLTTCLFF